MKKRNDAEFVGKKFNRLTAIRFIGRNKQRGHLWEFLCDCGNKCITLAYYVESGHSKSCGCLLKEWCHKTKFQHGLSKQRFHNLWSKILERCIDKNCQCYPRYGGRGIKICDRWLEFKNFFEDMYESYVAHVATFGEKNTTIERRENDKGYSPENCRWATREEQARNKRSNHPLVYNGETKIMVEWAEEFNLPYHILWKRIRRGWNVKKALETPIMVNQFKYK